MNDRLKTGRAKEKELARQMCEYALIRCFWQPPRAQYARVADNTGQDVFGVYDFVGVDHQGAVVGVQVCRKRPGEIGIRRSKISMFCDLYQPAMRAILASYDKAGFRLEELQPSGEWRLIGLLPHEQETP